MTTSSIVSKSAALLDIVSRAPNALRFSEIVEHSGYAKSSVHRLLANLIDEQLIACDRERQTYRPGTRLIEWASRMFNANDLAGVASDYLERLNIHTAAHVCLAVLQDDCILYLKTVDAHEPYRLAPRVGERSPIHCTAVGKAIMANLTGSRREKLMRTLSFERFTEHTIVSRKTFRLQLAQVKQKGYAVCDREEFLQIAGIAAPVFNQQDEVVAAVSLWDIQSRHTLRDLLIFKDVLRDCTQALSARLGSTRAQCLSNQTT